MECPTCSGALRVIPSNTLGAIGHVECHACGATHFVSRGNDPLRSSFRPFTVEEKDVIKHAREIDGVAVCPTDGTILRETATRIRSGVDHVVLQCPRCGHNAQYDREVTR